MLVLDSICLFHQTSYLGGRIRVRRDKLREVEKKERVEGRGDCGEEAISYYLNDVDHLGRLETLNPHPFNTTVR